MPLIKDMNFKESSKEELIKNYQDANLDLSFKKLVKKLELTDKEAMKVTSKLQDTINEIKNCQGCRGLFDCHNSYVGHVLIPEKKENRIYFSYSPCKYQKKFFKEKKEKDMRANLSNNARIKDIDMTGDKKRIEVIKWIDKFFGEYEYAKDMKGLYLHGSFGSGKTFLISALLHELEIEKHASILIVYFPEILRVLKDDWESYENNIKRLQTIDLLLLDDIGAEKVTEWGRDEVLGTILQYRMERNMPTFFTSNMNLKELETHLSNNGKGSEIVKARRIIERIKQISIPMELVSENRRK